MRNDDPSKCQVLLVLLDDSADMVGMSSTTLKREMLVQDWTDSKSSDVHAGC